MWCGVAARWCGVVVRFWLNLLCSFDALSSHLHAGAELVSYFVLHPTVFAEVVVA